MTYAVLLNYSSTLATLTAGDEVELAEGVARAINRDQQNTLALVVAEGDTDDGDNSKDEAEQRTLSAPSQNRMVTRAPRSRKQPE